MTEPLNHDETPEKVSHPDDYRARLYDAYVRTHTGGVSDRALPTLAHDVGRHVPAGGARVLDAGCGAGQLVRLLRAGGDREVMGIDASAEQVALAQQQGLAHIEQVDVVEYLSEHVAEFDAIVAVDVLEHFEKPDVLPLLDAIFAALRPGGRLVARVPNAESPFGSRTRYADFTHGTAFTHRSARQVLLATGFGSVSVYPTEPVAHGLASLVRLLLWKVLALAGHLYLMVETGLFRGHVLTQNMVVVGEKNAQLDGALRQHRSEDGGS